MNTDQALELLLDDTVGNLDSGDELEIDEDVDFSLPVDQESDQSEYEGKLLLYGQSVENGKEFLHPSCRDPTHWWERFVLSRTKVVAFLAVLKLCMMVNHCVVVGCTNYVGNIPGLRFYRFLSEHEPERRRRWTGAVRHANCSPGKHVCSCDEHFVTGF